MNWTYINRGASVLVATAYIVVMGLSDGSRGAFVAARYLILPLSCIWLSHYLGGYSGTVQGIPMTNPTPGCLIAGMGWFFLVGMPIVLWLLTK